MEMTTIQRDALARARRGDFELADAIELKARIEDPRWDDDVVCGYRAHRLMALGCGEAFDRRCDECRGTGDSDCDECEEGYVECHTCKGLGEVPGPLGISAECPKCEAFKKVRCPECDGEEVVDCAGCEGEGRVLEDFDVTRVIDLNGRVLWDEEVVGDAPPRTGGVGRPRMGPGRHPQIPRRSRRRRRGRHQHRGGRLMRATVSAADFAAALKQSVSVGTTPMPVLQHALIATGPDCLVLETSDSEVYVRTQIPAQVEAEGVQLLRTDLLPPVAAVEGEIDIHKEGRLYRGRSRFTIPGMLPDQWPGLETVEWQPMEMEPAALAAAIDAVAYAATEDDARTYLRGLNLGGGLAWSGDGSSLALFRLNYLGPAVKLPKRQVKRVRDMLAEGVELFVGNIAGNGAGMLRVDSKDSQLFVHLPDAGGLNIAAAARGIRYHEEALVMDRPRLVAALRRILPFARVGSAVRGIATVAIEATGEDLLMTDRLGQNVESIRDLLAEGTDVSSLGAWRLGIDAHRLLPAVSALQGGQLDLYRPSEASGTNTAWLLTPRGGSPDELAHFIAPIAL